MRFQGRAEWVLTQCTAFREDPILGLERLVELEAYDFASPRLRAELDGFARLSAEALDMPVGMINVVMDSAQYLAGRYGTPGWILHADGMTIEWSFCAEVVRSGTAYVVEDARADAIHSGSPLVIDDGVRSYAGVPLISPSGNALGTCCVLGTEPRHFIRADVTALQGIAHEVVEVMTQYRQGQGHRSEGVVIGGVAVDGHPVVATQPWRSVGDSSA